MEFLRNKEAKRTLFLFVFLSAVASGIAFWWNVGFGWLTLVLCALLFSVWFFSTRKRYRRLKELSCDIDGILHGQNRISLKEYSEGELAIL